MKRSFVPLIFSMLVALPASAELLITDAYMREPAPGQPNGAIYMTIESHDEASVRIVGASTPVAERAEIHEHRHADGMMRMRRVEEVSIEPGAPFVFRPHGHHLMVFGIKPGIEAGAAVPFCLQDDQGNEFCADATVRGME